jgi:hypothetical protein
LFKEHTNKTKTMAKASNSKKAASKKAASKKEAPQKKQQAEKVELSEETKREVAEGERIRALLSGGKESVKAQKKSQGKQSSGKAASKASTKSSQPAGAVGNRKKLQDVDSQKEEDKRQQEQLQRDLEETKSQPPVTSVALESGVTNDGQNNVDRTDENGNKE